VEILVVDDHVLIREALRDVVKGQALDLSQGGQLTSTRARMKLTTDQLPPRRSVTAIFPRPPVRYSASTVSFGG